MKKSNFYFKGGLAALLLLCLHSAVWSFAGNVYVASSIGGSVSLYSGTRVNQAGTGATTTLIAGTHYRVDPAVTISGTAYTPYVIFDAPNNPAYLLFDNGTQYHIESVSLGTTVPITAYVNSVRWYTKGQPTPPIITTPIRSSYDSASAAWTYPSAFEYSGVNIRILDVDNANAPLPATGGGLTTSLTGYPPSTTHNIGALLDGRNLTTDVDGHNYTFEISGVVDGQTPSAPAQAAFLTTSLGGTISTDKTWLLQISTTGINTIAVPFDPARGAISGVVGSAVTGIVASGGNLTVSSLIAEINRQAGAGVVTVFGWYDEVNQRHIGITSIAGNTVTGAANAAAILAMPVVQDRPYQVSVSAPVTFTLRGFRQ